MPSSATDRTTLRLGHSPDADDAFMFYALAHEKIPTGRWHFVHELQDIQTLNERCLRGDLDISAISIHAYPHVADQYALLNCGASMGDGYGPIVVARQPLRPDDLIGRCIAVPGEMTTAFLVLNLLLGRGRFAWEVQPFDAILPAVAEGRFDAGLIIHEGQLTYADAGLHAVVDLGRWWQEQTGLPLPLGGNVVRRALGEAAMREISALIRASIEYALTHREEAVRYALGFAGDLSRDRAERFVGMYVNEWTLDYGEAGRRAVRELLRRAHQIGLTPPVGEITFV